MARIPTIVSETSAQGAGYSGVPSGTFGNASGLQNFGAGVANAGEAIGSAVLSQRQRAEREAENSAHEAKVAANEARVEADRLERERKRMHKEAVDDEVRGIKGEILDRYLEQDQTGYTDGQLEENQKWYKSRIQQADVSLSQRGVTGRAEEVMQGTREQVQSLFLDSVRRYDANMGAQALMHAGTQMAQASADASNYLFREKPESAIAVIQARAEIAMDSMKGLTSTAARQALANNIGQAVLSLADNKAWSADEREQLFALATTTYANPDFENRKNEIRQKYSRPQPLAWDKLQKSVEAKRDTVAKTGNLEEMVKFHASQTRKMVAMNQEDDIERFEQGLATGVAQGMGEFLIFNKSHTGQPKETDPQQGVRFDYFGTLRPMPGLANYLKSATDEQMAALLSTVDPTTGKATSYWNSLEEDGQKTAVREHLVAKAVEHERKFITDAPALVVKAPELALQYDTVLRNVATPGMTHSTEYWQEAASLSVDVADILKNEFGMGDSPNPLPSEYVDAFVTVFRQQSPEDQAKTVAAMTTFRQDPNNREFLNVAPRMLEQVSKKLYETNPRMSTILYLASKSQATVTELSDLFLVSNQDTRQDEDVITTEGAKSRSAVRTAVLDVMKDWTVGMKIGGPAPTVEIQGVVDLVTDKTMYQLSKGMGDVYQTAQASYDSIVGRRYMFSKETMSGSLYGVELGPIIMPKGLIQYDLGFLDFHQPQGHAHSQEQFLEYIPDYVREFAGQPVALFGEDRRDLGSFNWFQSIFEHSNPGRLFDAPFAPEVVGGLDYDRLHIEGLPEAAFVYSMHSLKDVLISTSTGGLIGEKRYSPQEAWEALTGLRRDITAFMQSAGVDYTVQITPQGMEALKRTIVQRLLVSQDSTMENLHLFVPNRQYQMPNGKIITTDAPVQLQYTTGTPGVYEKVKIPLADIANSAGSHMRPVDYSKLPSYNRYGVRTDPKYWQEREAKKQADKDKKQADKDKAQQAQQEAERRRAERPAPAGTPQSLNIPEY